MGAPGAFVTFPLPALELTFGLAGTGVTTTGAVTCGLGGILRCATQN